MRPVLLGVVGDSGAGKSTITRGLVGALGRDNAFHISTDDYHKYDRKQRVELNITPLHPDCNYVDIIAQDLAHLRRGEPILKPVYRHMDGTFGPPVYVEPASFAVVEGLLGYHSQEMRDAYDVRVFLDPPEEIRRRWKVARDTSQRGYTEQEVQSEHDKREPDSAAFIRPQRAHANIVVSFRPGRSDEQDKLDAHLFLRNGLQHPDLSGLIAAEDECGLTLVDGPHEQELCVPGTIDPSRAAEIEQAIWEAMHFASHLREQRLGEFTVGTEVHRSESLALTQLLILYHLVTTKARVALGGNHSRTEEAVLGAEPAVA
ncbi:MAG: phosphoribulokinase [Actinomycetota bacterium]|nr:phosphoribulokinase [Actinomycetota bacterium]